MGGDTVAVGPLGDRTIDLLSLGWTSRTSKIGDERVISSNLCLDFASDPLGLRATKSTRLDSRCRVVISLQPPSKFAFVWLS